MPITSSALKALRRDEKRTVVNKRIRINYRTAVKEARLKKTAVALGKAFSALDRAAKDHVIHRNTAARLKSRLVKFVKRSGAAKRAVPKTAVPAKKVGKKLPR